MQHPAATLSLQLYSKAVKHSTQLTAATLSLQPECQDTYHATYCNATTTRNHSKSANVHQELGFFFSAVCKICNR